MGLELFCCHLIRLNHDIDKLVEIIYVGITKPTLGFTSGGQSPLGLVILQGIFCILSLFVMYESDPLMTKYFLGIVAAIR